MLYIKRVPAVCRFPAVLSGVTYSCGAPSWLESLDRVDELGENMEVGFGVYIASDTPSDCSGNNRANRLFRADTEAVCYPCRHGRGS